MKFVTKLLTKLNTDVEEYRDVEWNLRLNVGLVEDIKEKTGVDLDLLVDKPDDFGSFILSKPRKFVEMLWVICEEQAQKQGIDPKTFGRMFDRETLDSAGNALIEAILDFYPRSSAGRTIRRNLPRILKNMDDQIEIEVQKQIDRQYGKVSSGLPMNTGVFADLHPKVPGGPLSDI